MKNEKDLAAAQAKINRLIIKLGFEEKLFWWNVVVKNTNGGYCHQLTQCITIPLWAFTAETARYKKTSAKGKRGTLVYDTVKKYGFAEYYLCHETAHAICGPGHGHGKKFMKVLIKICPPDLVHYELMFRPREAAAAGIKNFRQGK